MNNNESNLRINIGVSCEQAIEGFKRLTAALKETTEQFDALRAAYAALPWYVRLRLRIAAWWEDFGNWPFDKDDSQFATQRKKALCVHCLMPVYQVGNGTWAHEQTNFIACGDRFERAVPK